MCVPCAVWMCVPCAIWMCVPCAVWMCVQCAVWMCVQCAVWMCEPCAIWMCVQCAVWMCEPFAVWMCVTTYTYPSMHLTSHQDCITWKHSYQTSNKLYVMLTTFLDVTYMYRVEVYDWPLLWTLVNSTHQGPAVPCRRTPGDACVGPAAQSADSTSHVQSVGTYQQCFTA